MHRAFLLITVLLLTVFSCASCSYIDPGTENDSKDLLRHVPVSASWSPEGAAPVEAGVVVRKQTYSIGRDGEFTFHRSLEISVAHLGAETGKLDQRAAERLGVEPFGGVLVRSVEKRGPASFAGLKRGDVIVSFGGKPVLSVDRLEYLIEEKKPSDLVDIEIERANEKMKLTVELGSEKRIESAKGIQQKLQVLDDRDRTGLRLAELTDETRPIVVGPGVGEKGLLVVDVLPGGPGYFAGVKARDYITKAGEQPLPSLSDYSRAVGSLDAGSDVRFAVLREGAPVEASVRIDSNATAQSGFHVPVVVYYEKKPSRRKLSLLMGALFNHERRFSIREKAGAAENYSSRNWGAILDLISYESNSRGKGHVQLLWIIPIWWGGD